MARLFAMGAALIWLVGCAYPNSPIPDDPSYAPIYPESRSEPVVVTGSIFNDGRSSGLFSDIKALDVGDVITVLLSESTSAQKSASNDMSRSSSASLAPINALGSLVTVNGNSLDFSYDDSFDSSKAAGAGQSNSLRGSITVNVMEVLGNGNLMIRGEKWITINDGDEFIRITGIVRPRDISPDNTIESTRVANARIQYSGTGTFADSQRSGWLARFFSGPLWPF